jgi:hypothetical protein
MPYVWLGGAILLFVLAVTNVFTVSKINHNKQTINNLEQKVQEKDASIKAMEVSHEKVKVRNETQAEINSRPASDVDGKLRSDWQKD